MYDKIRFGSIIFEFVRLDFLDNDRILDIYILPRGTTIQDVQEVVNNAHGVFEHLDINGTIVKQFIGFINLDNIEEATGAFNTEINEKILKITVSKPVLEEAVEQNTVNIEYIAAMTDIDLEG